MSLRIALVSLFAVIGTIGTIGAGTAQAQIQTRGPETFPGKNELSLHLGFQSGLTSYTTGSGFFAGGPPGGGRFTFDYGYRVNDPGKYSLWLDFGFAFTFGSGPGVIYTPNGDYASYGGSGYELKPFFGVKLKWRTPIPLVPYAKFNGEVAGIFGRYCGDNGVGFLAHAAGGVKYFLTRNIGLGIETGFDFGPAHYSGTNFGDPSCPRYYYPSHTELYSTIDFSAGAEFVF